MWSKNIHLYRDRGPRQTYGRVVFKYTQKQTNNANYYWWQFLSRLVFRDIHPIYSIQSINIPQVWKWMKLMKVDESYHKLPKSLSVSYLISSGRLLFENRAHYGSFQHLYVAVQWLDTTLPVSTWLCSMSCTRAKWMGWVCGANKATIENTKCAVNEPPSFKWWLKHTQNTKLWHAEGMPRGELGVGRGRREGETWVALSGLYWEQPLTKLQLLPILCSSYAMVAVKMCKMPFWKLAAHLYTTATFSYRVFFTEVWKT